MKGYKDDFASKPGAAANLQQHQTKYEAKRPNRDPAFQDARKQQLRCAYCGDPYTLQNADRHRDCGKTE